MPRRSCLFLDINRRARRANPKQILGDGIYRPHFFDFLTNMLVREQLLETLWLQERARERIQSE